MSAVVTEIELPVDLTGGDRPLGGLSGLAYDPACGLFYAITDDRGYVAPPRFHALDLTVDGPSVRLHETITLRDGDGDVFEDGALDPESIALTSDGILWVGTEGEAHRGLPPRILGFRLDGGLVHELDVPAAYLPAEGTGVRSNHGFEGLSVSPDGSRVIAAVESALVQDGPIADLDRGMVVRILVFDTETRHATGERAYRVEPVPDEPRPPEAYRSIGVSEILALDNDKILVMERSFSAGIGNTVRLFLADLTSGDDATGVHALAPGFRPVEKRLVADLADLGVDPDNLEGLSFGPVLADGRPTLVLVSDNNFQPDVQRNQLLVLTAVGIDPPERSRIAARISEIQGADHISPMVGRCVDGVEGTVTAILGQRKGQAFWIQQTPNDDDPRTSEGLFVTAVDGLSEIEVGDGLRLTGRIEEPSWRMELPVTRLAADGLEITGRERELPAPVVMGHGGRPIPSPNIDDDGLTLFEPDTDAIDYYESLEGMWVRVEDAVVVGPTSRYGEIVVLGDGGAHSSPRSGRGGVVLGPENAHPERITIDDRLAREVPAVVVGDRLEGGIDGVLHYSYGSFKLLNTKPLEVDAQPAHEPAPTSLVADTDHFTVATLNVENLHAGSDERKFEALASTIVHGLNGPTLLALQEIQDDSGPEDDGTVSAEATLDRLVRAVVGSGGPRYKWTQVDPGNNRDGGQPGANIRSALLFDPSRVTLAVPPEGHTGHGLGEEPHLHVNPMVIGEGSSAFNDSRRPLWAEVEVEGEKLLVIVCHLRSKGGDDPLFGRRQPPLRTSERQRLEQAGEIRSFVDSVLQVDPDIRVIVLGDLNDFEFSESVKKLAAPPMVNLVDWLPVSESSTYVYQGNSQTLDHIIVSPALADGARVEVIHVNSEFPASGRASDHDPVIARLPIP